MKNAMNCGGITPTKRHYLPDRLSTVSDCYGLWERMDLTNRTLISATLNLASPWTDGSTLWLRWGDFVDGTTGSAAYVAFHLSSVGGPAGPGGRVDGE